MSSSLATYLVTPAPSPPQISGHSKATSESDNPHKSSSSMSSSLATHLVTPTPPPQISGHSKAAPEPNHSGPCGQANLRAVDDTPVRTVSVGFLLHASTVHQ